MSDTPQRTPFGLCLEKLRNELKINQKEMAALFNYSAGWLNNVEFGKSYIVESYIVQIIATVIPLLPADSDPDEWSLALMKTYILSNNTVTLNLKGLDEAHLEVAALFISRYKTISEPAISKIRAILNE